jgi:hypothetical protein
MPVGTGYAVWGKLDSLNNRSISAEIDQYYDAFAAFGCFAII